MLAIAALPLVAQLIRRDPKRERHASNWDAFVFIAAGLQLVALGGLFSSALVLWCAGEAALAVGITLINSEAPGTASGWLVRMARGVPLGIFAVGGTLVTVALVNPSLADTRLFAGVGVMALGSTLIARDFAGAGALLEGLMALILARGPEIRRPTIHSTKCGRRARPRHPPPARRSLGS